MNTIGKQITDLINNNVPKNIDLVIPVNQDTELKEILQQLINKVEENNKEIQAVRRQLYVLETKWGDSFGKDWYDFK